MKDGQAIIICAEMKHPPYNLKGSTLEVFSALYSLTKKRAFLGTYQDLANWIEIDLETLKRALKKLQERDLVTIENEVGYYARYEFQAHHIKGYPLPDYKYCGRKSFTETPVIDSQNIEEYRRELELTQNEQVVTQNEQVVTQNEQVSKEKNQKKNNYNIYNNKLLHKEEVVGDKPTAAPPFGKKKEENNILPPPTSFQEVWDYVQEKQPGISMEVAMSFYIYYSAKGWRYKHNGLVRNWKAELFLFDQRGKRWEKERATKACTRYQQGGRQEEPSYAQIIAKKAMEKQKEAERAMEEEHDRLANTPEAKAAAARVLAKFCK